MTVLFAQAPEKFSYQAVVRNASNALVANTSVGVRVSVLQGDANGNAMYVETHTAVTNANGLLTIEIGGGNVQQGSFAGINWADGPYFLKTETDPDGGSNYTDPANYTLLFEETIDAEGGAKVQGAWKQKTASLQAYAGQTVHIAFRHFNSTDMYYINLDDVVIQHDCADGE